MTRPIKHVVAVLLACFTLLFVQLNRVQVYQAQALVDHPANTRTIQRDFDRPRGKIVTRDDVIVADSEPSPGGPFSQQRVYPHDELYAHTVGYTSFTFGAEGVEREYNDALIGRTASQELSGLTDLLGGTNPIGDIRLTLRDDMQRRARESLGARRGAVVALDPDTGEIYALWSFPSYNPNSIAVNDGSLANEAWTELVNAEGNPLRAKAYRDIFFPGSTFKVVTAASALDNGVVGLVAPEFEVTDSYTPPLTERPIANFGGSSCGGNLVEALVVSCNTTFAKLGAELLGPQLLTDTAEEFGFNNAPPLDLPIPVDSEFPTDFGALVREPTAEIPAGVFEDTPSVAQSAIGQNSVSATPLQMALVAAAVANGGEIPVPHVMLAVEDSDSGRQTDSFDNRAWRRAMSSATAADLTLAMIDVVERGSGSRAAVPGLVIGGKTGTAEAGTDPPTNHAWMIAFGGRADEPARLAVAVLVEGDAAIGEETGGRVAAPIARDLFEQFFQ